jgi:hypothetical protein
MMLRGALSGFLPAAPRLGFGFMFLVFLLLLVCWLYYVFGLSLISYWFICVAPVRGGTYFSLPAAKKSRQKKAGSNRQHLGVLHGCFYGVVRARSVPSHTPRL